jgi:hypothetical protein
MSAKIHKKINITTCCQLKYKKKILILPHKKSLKIPKGKSESIYRRRTDNTMAKRKIAGRKADHPARLCNL